MQIKQIIILFALYPLYSIGSVFISLSNPKKNWGHFYSVFQSQHPLKFFVESGTYLGETAKKASEYFSEVHTIEVSEEFYRYSSEALKNNKNIKIYQGDSAKILPTILPRLKKTKHKVLFWLDGHFMSSMIGEQDNILHEYGYTPILGELEAIVNAQIDDAVILIDDIRLFGTQLNEMRIELAGNADYPLLNDIVGRLSQHGYKSIVFGDMLCAYPSSSDIAFSPVVEACTQSRLFDGYNSSDKEILAAEKIISMAALQEKDALVDLYDAFSKDWRQWRNRSPHYNLWNGLMLQHQSKHQEAYEQFNKVLNLGYNHWRIHWYITQSLLEMKDYVAARSAFERVVHLNPKFETEHKVDSGVAQQIGWKQ